MKTVLARGAHWPKKTMIKKVINELDPLREAQQQMVDEKQKRAAKARNETLEEVAQEFDKMRVLGDTAASFAAFVRGMKK